MDVAGRTVPYKETIEHAAKRIAKRELGASIRVIKPLGYIEFPSEEKEKGFGWTVTIAVLCKTKKRAFRTNEEASKIELFQALPKGTNIEQSKFLKGHRREIKLE